MSAEALTDDECRSIVNLAGLHPPATYVQQVRAYALIRAGYKAGAEAMAETCAEACEGVDTIINVYNSPLNGLSHPVAEQTSKHCAQACRDAARGKP